MVSRVRKRVLFWFSECAVLFVFWLLYVDKIDVWELMVGLAAAALAATGSEAVRGMNFTRFYPYKQWFLLLWRVPGMVIEGCWILLKVLVLRNVLGRDIQGELKTVAFDPGGDDPRSAARRALAIALTTIAPNSIVVWIDRREHLILLHQMLSTGVPAITRDLGAQP